ncbi:MAG: hypothetical protein FJX62_02630 [Alphaproteobacteria bacterium]|nr:hypothetical protein [Alphaproteobacteria bacterium]
MRKLSVALTVIAAALALTCQSADAGGRKHGKGIDRTVKHVGIGVGAGMTVAYFAMTDWKGKGGPIGSGGAFALTTIGCTALSPMVATAVVNRPLTMREGHVLIADCILPFIGAKLVNAAYDKHPEWEGKKPRKGKRR